MNDLIYLMHHSFQKLQIVFKAVISRLFAFKIARTTEPFYNKVGNTVHGMNIKLAAMKWWIQVPDTKYVWALIDCLQFCWVSNNGNSELSAPKALAWFLLKLHSLARCPVANCLEGTKVSRIRESNQLFMMPWSILVRLNLCLLDRIGELIGIASVLLIIASQSTPGAGLQNN